MSFQGIRKIREARRQSPLLIQGIDLPINCSIKPIQLNFDLKSSNLSNDIRTTRDSDGKVDTISRHTRKSSFGITSSSKQKQKKTLIGNFLHFNLDGLKNIKPSKQLRSNFGDTPRTQRISVLKSSTEDYSNQLSPRISLNSFTLDFIVGKGGFGKVWKVHQKSTKKIYAMKQMQKVKIVSKRSVHSVMNQKTLLQVLKNPFIVNMIYSFQNRQNLFLVMDYCNRGDLRYHLACMVLALQYLHGKRVIHRDLKPQNLVIDDKGYIRVTDLGVSRQVKPNNAQDTSGTPGYMAPQVICKMNHSYPVDFFALGVMGYEFMTGKRPYLGANRKQIRQKILSKQVQLDQIPPYGWSRQSVDFINRLIQRKPDCRLGTNGIQQVKFHPFFKKIDWQKLSQKKIQSPFLPDEDYNNYKQCISEDTQIQNMEQYKMILRHKDTQQAFEGYDYNIESPTLKKKIQRKQFQQFTHTTMNIRRKR